MQQKTLLNALELHFLLSVTMGRRPKHPTLLTQFNMLVDERGATPVLTAGPSLSGLGNPMGGPWRNTVRFCQGVRRSCLSENLTTVTKARKNHLRAMRRTRRLPWLYTPNISTSSAERRTMVLGGTARSSFSSVCPDSYSSKIQRRHYIGIR
eukprot:Rmarinus@m.18052